MKRPLTRRERIGYEGENLAIKILERESFCNIRKLGGPCDFLAEKEGNLYLIDVKASTVNKRKLPVHDHSLVDLINLCKAMKAKPLILVLKPSRYNFVDPFRLLQETSSRDVCLYKCYLRKGLYKDIEEMLELRKDRVKYLLNYLTFKLENS